MVSVIKKPAIIKAAGDKPKVIEEYIGRVNTKTEEISIARMKSPGGWAEPGQRPQFDEYTVVLKGVLCVKTENETVNVKAGEAVIAHRGQWVRYSTPQPKGAEYIAVCIPAFSVDTVHRDK